MSGLMSGRIVRSGVALTLLVITACSRSAPEYVKRGDRFFQEQKYADAEINYRKATQQDSAFGSGYFGLGQTLLKEGKGREAYDALVRAYRLLPDDREVQSALSGVALSAYLADSRRPRFLHDQLTGISETLLSKDPASFVGLRIKGVLALDEKRPNDAILAFQAARKSKPNDPDGVLGLSQAYFLDGQFAEGEKLSVELIGKDKGFLPIYDVLYTQYLAKDREGDAEQILKLKGDNNPKQAELVLQLARFYAFRKQPDKVNAALQRLLDHPANFPNATLQVGDFYAGVGMWPEAIRQYETGAKAHPDQSVTYEKRIARSTLAMGKPEDAQRVLEQVLSKDPGDVEARSSRATIWLESGAPDKLDRAIEELRKLVSEHGEDPALRWNLGRAWFRKGQLDTAAVEFSEALRNRGDFVPAYIGLAETALLEKKYDLVLRRASEILTLSPGNPRARLLDAEGRIALGQFDAARHELSDLQLEFPHQADVQVQLGLLAMAERRFNDAEAIFRGLGQSQLSDPRSSMGLAEVYLSQNQSQRALGILKDQVARSPSSRGLRTVLATLAMRLGEYDLALQQYQYLLSKDPASVPAILGISEAYRLKGDLSSAIATLDRAVQDDPKSQTPIILLASLFENSGRVEDAKKYYRRALELHPDPYVMNNLAYLMEESGDNLDEAQRLTQRAMQKLPNQPAISDTLGLIYLKKGMRDSASQIFTNLVKQNPDVAVYRYHFALTLVETGDKQKARTELTEALRNNPTSDLEQKIRAALAKI
jgi:tetratricopeptide (TPR) repeat protein